MGKVIFVAIINRKDVGVYKTHEIYVQFDWKDDPK